MRRRIFIGLFVIVLTAGVLTYAIFLRSSPLWEPIKEFEQIDREARIFPDYQGTTIPPNIAPLNFLIREPGVIFCARVASQQGETIEVFSRDGVIQIPPERWRDLLENNKGETLQIDIYVKNEKCQWHHFRSVKNFIAEEEIDGFAVYRKMYPTHLRVRGEIGIYCRDLGSFKESVILSGMSYENGCLNCHSFPRNQGDKMLIGVRSKKYGAKTLLVEDGRVQKLGGKFGYTSWHPSGRMAVYAMNNLPMFYHSARNEVRDTVNIDSYLAYYLCEPQKADVEPKLARKDRLENWPAWSADGRYLYFCSAPKLWPSDTRNPPELYDQVQYDLVRIAYDIDTHTWGEIETVLSAKQIGKGIGMPRCSPDGRWLSFCMFDYGYFPSWKQESDVYVIDLQHPEQDGSFSYRPLEINSDQSEGWHAWSSNGRWILFSSKRLHGVFTRLFISYVDSTGKAHQPFVLPQEDPRFYESYLRMFNTPELVTTAPTAVGETLAKVYRGDREVLLSMPVTMATPNPPQVSPTSAWENQRE
ncbi:MAG: PD40 domain-containing protein [Sedimentisphaerales bacterium]|nr:PD40 domain-containing protein [Sedimentisphaerales bacterium]